MKKFLIVFNYGYDNYSQGVESDKCPSFSAAMEHGKPVNVHVDNSGTLSDGLAVSKVGDNAFRIAAPLLDKMASDLCICVSQTIEKICLM